MSMRIAFVFLMTPFISRAMQRPTDEEPVLDINFFVEKELFVKKLPELKQSTLLFNPSFLSFTAPLLEFQKLLFRLQQQYDVQKKEKLRKLPLLQAKRLQKYAQAELVKKKKEYEAQYMTVEEFAKKFRGKKEDEQSNNYLSIHCHFKRPRFRASSVNDIPNGISYYESAPRYLIQDHFGNESVYADFLPYDTLSSKLKDCIDDYRKQLKDNNRGGRIIVKEGDNENHYHYYVNTENIIETYRDERGVWKLKDITALCTPAIFIAKIEKNLEKKSRITSKILAHLGEKGAPKLKELMTKGKELEKFKELLKEYGVEKFYEKTMSYKLLNTKIGDIDSALQKGHDFLAICYEEEELYGWKKDNGYYLYGVILESTAPDAHVKVVFGSRNYAFAEELAKVTHYK